MMFTKLKNAFLGRNRMSKKQTKEIAYFLQYEYKFDKDQAEYLAQSGEWKQILEAYGK